MRVGRALACLFLAGGERGQEGRQRVGAEGEPHCMGRGGGTTSGHRVIGAHAADSWCSWSGARGRTGKKGSAEGG